MEIWAEAGQCEGDLDYAFRAVDAIAGAGADAIKVQMLRPETIASPGAVRYDAYGNGLPQRSGFYPFLDYTAWGKVAEHAEKRGIGFIPAVFDEEAVLAGSKLSPVLKIASGDITNLPLIEAAAHEADQGLVISTGAATQAEIEQAVGWVRAIRGDMQLTLLACHLQYPTHPSDAHLGRILALGQLAISRGWPAQIGYSDHTTGNSTTPLLTAMGVSVQEKHFTLLGKGHGGDHEFAVGADELREMVSARDAIIGMFGYLELQPTTAENAARTGARRSVHATRDIKKGEVLTKENTAVLRPHVEGALTPAKWEEFIEDKAKAMEDIGEGEPVMEKLVGSVGASLTVE